MSTVEIESEEDIMQNATATVSDEQFMDSLNAQLDQLLDPNIIQLVDEEHLKQMVAEGDKINMERWA